MQLWQSWARMETRLGQTSQALQVYKRAVSLYPQDEQLVVGWAKVQAEALAGGPAVCVLQAEATFEKL